jgi:hypothetical protein
MKHLHAAPTTLALSTLSLVAGLAGCYVAEPGVNGQLAFVPSECGQLVCDFDDRLAVGATVEVEVQAADGRDVEGIELISGDSAVFEVIARDEFDLSRFTLRGTGAGTADLIGIDGAGHEIDFAPITIALATDVQLDVLGGDVQGPTAADPLTDEYQLAAGTAITITARPADAGGALMGVTPFDVFIDEDIDAALDASDRLDLGNASFDAPAGGHALTFVAPGGAERTALLTAE